MTDKFDPLTEGLRESLARHAADAPRGDYLAERIIATAEQTGPTAHRPRGWRTWTLPLIAAGAVAGVVAAVVGIENFHPSAGPVQPGTHGRTQAPTVDQTTPLPTTTPTVASTTTVATTPPAPAGQLTNVQVADLTFADNMGWALGSADCVNGPGRCTAMWRTSDGRNWTSMPGAAFNVPGVNGCADPCVEHIRFANDQVGYAFGQSALFLTSDGGASWQRQPGGALQLETLDGNVIRVTSSHSGCPGPCDIGVEVSAIGSGSWTSTESIPNTDGVGGALLSRGGSDAYLLLTRNPASGAPNQTSTLYRSTDDGQSWQAVGEPCPQTGQEVDSVAIAAGRGNGVSALCMTRQAPYHYRVVTSTDAGSHFATHPGEIPLGSASLLTGDPDTVLVAAGDGMARSTDGGATWQPVTDVTGRIGFVGFESDTVGRAVSADGSTIWTTRDAGLTWHAASIG